MQRRRQKESERVPTFVAQLQVLVQAIELGS
jgi:hypothetical protein